MPGFVLDTNVCKSKIPENFHKELTAVVAESVGKPEQVSPRSIVLV